MLGTMLIILMRLSEKVNLGLHRKTIKVKIDAWIPCSLFVSMMLMWIKSLKRRRERFDQEKL